MKLYIVGFGPGSRGGMTLDAAAAIERSGVIVGYTLYADIIKRYFPDKEFISAPMRGERERAEAALKAAAGGKTAAVISSGDGGVYGMASLVLSLAPRYPGVETEIVPGVTAALSGAALLGAPLGHDFAVISLSDLLTPRETIEKRLEAAAWGDFVTVIYNPSSKKRADHLRRACDILLKYKSADTVCGTAKNIGRGGEETGIMTLAELKDTETDMFTTVFVGNRETKIINGKMVTPRGYKNV